MDKVEAFKGILYVLADGAKFLFTTNTESSFSRPCSRSERF
jgi:ribosomal protein L24E